MIRGLIGSGLAVMLLGAAPAVAQSATFERVETQELAFVAQTAIPSREGQTFDLCHLYQTQTLNGFGLWRSSVGYVLSENGCQGSAYYDNPAQIAFGFASGQIAEDVPPNARLSAMDVVTGFTIPLAMACLALLALVSRFFVGRPAKSQAAERMEVLGLEDGPTFRFIDAMLHAANADGRVKREEIVYIREKATDLTGLDYADEHIEWAITHTDRFRKRKDFKRFGAGLTEDQKRVVLRGALAIVASDQHMSRAEKAFIERLTDGLNLRDTDLHAILDGGMVPA